MSRVVLIAEDLDAVRKRILGAEDETCAVLVGRHLKVGGRLARIVIHEVVWPCEDDYERRSPTQAVLRPSFVARMAKRARLSGESLIFAHSHPFCYDSFSEVDDSGEAALRTFLEFRTPGIPHAALLFTPNVIISRALGGRESYSVAGIGASIKWGTDVLLDDTNRDKFDRQLRVFGAEGQNRLRSLRVGIVGLGGTGAIVAEQLAHLGVSDFLLLDPDTVEVSNLNRLVGATSSDVGRPKVVVASDLIRRIQPHARVDADATSVLLNKNASKLADVDFLFCCTDSHGSRAVLNQLSYQYLVPMIDMGVVILAANNHTPQLIGRTQMLGPGLGCLVCGNLLDPESVRVDLLTDFERQADPYIIGTREPAPAVISLNGTLASMAVTMFLSAAAGVPSSARLINYNGNTGSSRAARITAHPTCYVCSREGALARSTEWPLAGRESP